MTTTPDEVALLAAIAANPDDVSAKLAYADLVGESDPLQGCMLRILADPDCDDWRLQYAQAIEPVDAVRAEFIRVQCGLATTPRFDPYRCEGCGETADADGKVVHGAKCGYPGSSEYIGSRRQWIDLRNRDLRLLDAHEADWRKAGPCSKCYRKINPVTREQTPMGCNSCNGTGDVGMLCGRENTLLLSHPSKPGPFRHPVQWRRGFIEQIDARLDEVLKRCCGLCNGSGRYGEVSPPSRGVATCDRCRGTGQPAAQYENGWRPTARALAWVREFPTCQRVRLVDRVPFGADFPRLGNRHLFYPADDGDQLTDHCIPRLVYDVMQGERIRLGFVPEAISYATAEAAHEALARAAVAVLRAHRG